MTSIKMPQLGETIIEGTILKWLKQEGEAVERDEPLFEISTDKVDTEVPSPVAGTVSKILIAEGETVAVGTELAVVDDGTESAVPAPGTASAGGAAGTGEPARSSASDEGSSVAGPRGGLDAPSAPPAAAPTSPSPPPAPAPAAAAASVPSSLPDRGPQSQVLSPLVRRLAAEHALDLSLIAGSGTGGRITKKDVEAAIAAGSAAESAGAAPALRAVPSPSAAVAGAGEEVVPMTHIRKAIAQHMVASLQVGARAWTMVEVNVDHLVKLRERVKDAFFERYGVKLTYLPMVTRATTEALLEFPMVNAELRGDDLIVRKYVHMGVAVSYDQGLIVPVVRNADSMNVPGLARSIADLAARARSHSLQPDEVTGATFTITNPGPYGSLLSVPIINQPNAGILSLDGIQKRPVVVDDAIAIRSMVYISMSWDHRVVDGELATRFLARVKHNLETWDFAEDLGV